MSDPRVLEQAWALAAVLRRIRRHVIRRHSQAFAHGTAGPAHAELTLPQMNMLLVVRERGKVTIKELADALSVSPPSASAMVERLVDIGVLVREHSQVDRRVVEVHISPGAKQHIAQVEDHILHSLTGILEQIGPRYAQMWCEVYAKIDEVLARQEGAGPDETASRQEFAK